MNRTMKWILINEQEDYVVFRCSVCNSEITVKYGEELPYCKHCESEPDGEQVAKKMIDNEIIKALNDHIKSGERIKHGARKITVVNVDLLKNALNLINCKDEQIKSLISGQETLQKYIAEKDAEIERLGKSQRQWEATAKTFIMENAAAKSEAVKEFVEMLKPMYKVLCVDEGDWYNELDNLVKKWWVKRNDKNRSKM